MINQSNSFLLFIFLIFNPAYAVTFDQFMSNVRELPIYQKLNPNLPPNRRTEIFYLGNSLLKQYEKQVIKDRLLQINEMDLWKLTMFLSVMLISLDNKISQQDENHKIILKGLELPFPLNLEQIIIFNQRAISCTDLIKAVNFANDIYSLLMIISGFYLKITSQEPFNIFAEQILSGKPLLSLSDWEKDFHRLIVQEMINRAIWKL